MPELYPQDCYRFAGDGLANHQALKRDASSDVR